jgi:hypothetical protein
MDIGALFAWLSNAVVCGVLAVMIVFGWIWFTLRAVHARRSRRAGVNAGENQPPMLKRLDRAMQVFSDWPFDPSRTSVESSRRQEEQS